MNKTLLRVLFLGRGTSVLKKFIGPKSFYEQSFRVALPLAMTMLLSSCMSIVDSLMVSHIGMVTAVGNASQIMTIHDGVSWGITAGIAIFASQFFGSKNHDNMTRTLGLSFILTLANAFLWLGICLFKGRELLLFYLDDASLVEYSLKYLNVAIFSTIPFALNNSLSVLYKATHNTKLTFCFSLAGAILNVIFNSVFIFYFNVGVVGAAYGTLLSQCVVFLCYVYHSIKYRPFFLEDVSLLLDLKFSFIKPIVSKILPLIINETLFSFGATLFVKAYGLLGTTSMDAYYVANQVYNLFVFIVWGYGGAVSILIGTRLGAGQIKEAIEESRYQLALALVIGLVIVTSMLLTKGIILDLYNVNDVWTYKVADALLWVMALKAIIRMFTYVIFSTLRAGGDAKILNFLDSGITYIVGIPLAFIAVYGGIEDIVLVLLICQFEQVVRLILSLRRYKSNIWAQDLTKSVEV